MIFFEKTWHNHELFFDMEWKEWSCISQGTWTSTVQAATSELKLNEDDSLDGWLMVKKLPAQDEEKN